MPATGFITRIGAALLLACLLAGLLFSATARAGECGRLCDEAFWKTATAEQIEVEIARGADPNARIEGGFTPLHFGARLGSAETVKALLKAGADLEARNNYGATPLHGAAVWGTAEIVEALARAGADPKARTEGGWTPPAFRGGKGNG